MQTAEFKTSNSEEFKTKALLWANQFRTACYFDSNNFQDPYSAFDVCIAADALSEINCQTGEAFNKLNTFLKKNQGFVPGFLSYDLKNEIENLVSENSDQLHFPDLYFFSPANIILIKGNQVSIKSDDAEIIWKEINQTLLPIAFQTEFDGSLQNRIDKSDYLNKVDNIKLNIRKGDIYELNFCQEFYAANANLNPVHTFIKLNRISPTPFATFFKTGDKYIISATPERFLSRRGNKLISQPIKGTAKRFENTEEDSLSKSNLLSNEKELSENVMIVDLVRNDLTKSAKPGTVQVEELFGVYSFKQVHQMISTIVCEPNEELSNSEIIKNTFPMGSMTGAPKIRAMELIEKYEESKRGLYSGAVGYFSEENNFDFNVVIRSILYNAANKFLSFQVGSAITIDSDPEKEYEECLLKAEAIFKVLQS